MTTGSTTDARTNGIELFSLREDTLDSLARDLGVSAKDVILVTVSTRQGELISAVMGVCKVLAKIEDEFRQPLEEAEKLINEVKEEARCFPGSPGEIGSFYVGAVYEKKNGVLASKQCKLKPPPGGGRPQHVEVECEHN